MSIKAKTLKKRNAWLITWESPSKDYFAALNRPRVVAILKPQIGLSTIKKIMPALFFAESKLNFSEKIGFSLSKQSPYKIREDSSRIRYGDNPWLEARLVKNLYVETYSNTEWRETLHWTEYPRNSHNPTETDPCRDCFEDVHFDIMWHGQSFLEIQETT